uniref:Gnk2-homologous domain-containing protein n=1 Tax=Fagus sylvatica TaxID=28930 RepID=A0A2N9F953_FAGSY
MDEDPRQYVSDNQSMPEVERFNKLLATMIDDLVTQATSAQPNAKKFATKEANFSSSLTLYSLVQCTPDLSSFSCNKCIRGAVANLPYCCGGKQGAMILYPSCVVRYETYPFYQIIQSPPPPPAPAGSVTRTKNGKSKISSVTVIAIVTPIAVSVLLLSMLYCCHSRKRRKKYKAKEENAANEITTLESLIFDLAKLKAATNKFSDDNKLGHTSRWTRDSREKALKKL